ncbi:MAG: energy transducer TonB, partial [Marinobacter sp.]|nr:energy transducer TonB [Marinobacter sp.]
AMALAIPKNVPTLNPLGEAAVNSTPAMKIALAGAPRQKPVPPEPEELAAESRPAPEPEPEPEPELENEPEPEPAAESPEQTDTEQKTDDTAEQSADNQRQNQQVELSAGTSRNVDEYLSRLSRHLSRFYEYPRRARRLGQEGSPVIVFEFNRSGTLVDVALRESSGHTLLDDAAMTMLAQAAPLPEVPATMPGERFRYALPVRFNLR